jgi:hypothetical protein
MDQTELPIINFGNKYRGKPITEFLADIEYVEWCKLQDWFKKTNVYNIVVNQTITSNNNSKTPEHNKLQNSFLDKEIKYKFINYIYKNRISNIKRKLSKLYKNDEFNTFFEKKNLDNLECNIDDDKIIFEAKFNWDLLYSHERNKDYILFTSNEKKETEEKEKFKNECNIILEKIYNEIVNEFQLKETEYLEKYNKELEEYNKKLEKCTDKGMLIKPYLKTFKLWTDDFDKYFSKYNIFSLNISNHERETFLEKYSKFDVSIHNDKFEEAFKRKKLAFYKDMFKEFNYIYIDYIDHKYFNIYINFNQYSCSNILFACELKPTMGDDYPNVLRKIKQQIELTKSTKNKKSSYDYNLDIESDECNFFLIINQFNSSSATKEQLIEIFKQSNIYVIFFEDIINKNEIPINKDEIIKKLNDELLLKNEEYNELLRKYKKVKKLYKHLEKTIS